MKDSAYIDIRYRKGIFNLVAKTFIPGGIVGVFGPSGHGKSTLLKLLAGIDNPDYGQIIIQGQEVFNRSCKINIPTRKRNLGMVFQEGLLFPHMSVRKNLLYGYNNTSSISFNEVVSLLEIEDLLDKKPQQCSGGEKQRIAIGRMLLSSPSVLMLDEPFSGLDQRLRRNIIPYLLKIHEKFRLPIIVVSHDLVDLLMLTDQLMIIENGLIKGIGSYNELYFKSETRHVLQEEESVNVVRLKVNQLEERGGMHAIYYHIDYPENYLLIKENNKIGQGKQLILNISPGNISLSTEKLSGISARNQLMGKIVSIHEVNNKVYCKVDVGVVLLVEITQNALQGMNLKVDDKVCCLFKTSSMKIFY